MLVVTAILSILIFGWPLLGLGGLSATVALAAMASLLLALVAMEVGARRLDSRGLALLAAIAAVDAALRLALVEGIGGFSPIFFLVICAGYVFGPRYGFVCGGISLLASAVATGGIGPWLPYEMLATGWVGAGAGLVGLMRHGRQAPLRAGWREVVPLAVAALLLGFLYGIATDLWDWTYYPAVPGLGWAPGLGIGPLVVRFARFYVSTSLLWDSFRGIGTALLVILLGRPVLTALGRIHARFNVTIDVEDDAGRAAATQVATATVGDK